MMEYDIHTVLDGLTLIATVGVIFCMTLQPDVKITYQKDQDKLKFYFVVSGRRLGSYRDSSGEIGVMFADLKVTSGEKGVMSEI